MKSMNSRLTMHCEKHGDIRYETCAPATAAMAGIEGWLGTLSQSEEKPAQLFQNLGGVTKILTSPWMLNYATEYRGKNAKPLLPGRVARIHRTCSRWHRKYISKVATSCTFTGPATSPACAAPGQLARNRDAQLESQTPGSVGLAPDGEP
jgi:hypothetical protein